MNEELNAGADVVRIPKEFVLSILKIIDLARIVEKRVKKLDRIAHSKIYSKALFPKVRGQRLEQVLLVRNYLEEHPGSTIKAAAKTTFSKIDGGYPSYLALSAYCYSNQGFVKPSSQQDGNPQTMAGGFPSLRFRKPSNGILEQDKIATREQGR